MIHMTTQELCQAINGELIAGIDGEFTGVSIDSRQIESGQLFFAILGEKMDGHQFVENALSKGGVGAVVDHILDIPLQAGQFLIRVQDTTKALQKLGHYYRAKFNLKVIGITGSVGKTTTKDMIAAVLQTRFNVLKTEGNLNNYYGLPLTLFKIQPTHEVLVVEMGMSSLKEIELLAKLAEPEIGVVTNVGHSHMEYLKTLDNVAKAKQELVENLVGDRIAVLNGDDLRVRSMAKIAKKTVFYGTNNAEYLVLETRPDRELTGIDFSISVEDEQHSFHIPIAGEHNAYNALAAIAVGRIMGLEFSQIQEGLAHFKPSKMRMNIIKTEQEITLLNDAYNANPASMQAALQVLAGRKGRKIAVLGDMLELGEFAESAHREVGRRAVEAGVDLLFIKGDYREVMADGAEKAGLKAEKIFTSLINMELADRLKTMLLPGDTVLIKGSRGMAMEEIVKSLLREE